MVAGNSNNDGQDVVTGEDDDTRVTRDIVLPGTRASFEGTSVWLQAAPRAVLDIECRAGIGSRFGPPTHIATNAARGMFPAA